MIKTSNRGKIIQINGKRTIVPSKVDVDFQDVDYNPMFSFKDALCEHLSKETGCEVEDCDFKITIHVKKIKWKEDREG